MWVLAAPQDPSGADLKRQWEKQRSSQWPDLQAVTLSSYLREKGSGLGLDEQDSPVVVTGWVSNQERERSEGGDKVVCGSSPGKGLWARAWSIGIAGGHPHSCEAAPTEEVVLDNQVGKRDSTS